MSNSQLKIKSLRVKAFRGIGAEQLIKLNQRHLLLVGENGTGKSSFTQAIELALTGTVSSLTGTQRVSVARHCTHVKFTDQDRLAEIHLTDGQADYQVVPGQDLAATPPNVRAFLKAAADGSFILRRNKLLEFVESKDKDRYDALRPFLGLDDFDKFEGILKQASDACAADGQKASLVLAEKQKGMRTLLGMAPTDVVEQQSVLNRANVLLAEAGFSPVSHASEIAVRHADAVARISALGDTETPIRASKLATAVANFTSAIQSLDAVEQLSKAIDVLHQESVKFTGHFNEMVLRGGQVWIEKEALDLCPLCEQMIDRKTILEKVSTRLFGYKTLIEARNNVAQQVAALKELLSVFQSRYDDALKAWVDAGLQVVDWPYATLHSLVANLQRMTPQSDWQANSPVLQQHCNAVIAIDFAEIQAKLQQGLSGLAMNSLDEKQLKSLLALQAILKALQLGVPELVASEGKVVRTKKIAARARALYDGAVKARKEASKKIFRSIEADMRSIYTAFHPNESLGGIAIEVKETGSGSALFKTDFADRSGEDPRAYYSEAHQDTLGLATFLALRKRMLTLVPSFRLIVLDDVLTSVDGQHRERIANYLLTETARDHQLVITTHNRPWYEWLIQIQAELGVRSNFHNTRITDWTLEDGPVLSDITSDYEILVRDKATVTAENLVPIAGRFFEGILCQLRYSLALAVPARFDERYTIGDIWDKFFSACKSDYKPLWQSIVTECENLKNTKVIRNWGTHDNRWFKEITKAEALQFIDPILALYPKIHCSHCGTFVKAMETPRGAVSCRKGCTIYLPTPNVTGASPGK